jgi:hypothetical protein
VSDKRDIRSDLEPETPDELVELAERLLRERPAADEDFVATLRRALTHPPAEDEPPDGTDES